MLKLSALVAATAALGATAQSGYGTLPYDFITPYNHTCIFDRPELSCVNGGNTSLSPKEVDSCCIETFGGLILSTEFWTWYSDVPENEGKFPQDSWTIHGLWPDFCNGSYTGYCDISRQYDPDPSPTVSSNGTNLTAGDPSIITKSLEGFGALDLLKYINKFWVSRDDTLNGFVGHEFSKHATCFSNFQTECYGPKYQEGEDIVDFIATAVGAFKKYDTFNWLAEKGIKPSNETGVSYTYKDIVKALEKRTGKTPYVGCSGPSYNETEEGAGSDDDGRTYLSEVWYYNLAKGRVQDLDYVPVDNPSSYASCATSKGAIKYFERATGLESTD